jgi:integrase/recombinase XerC
VIDYISEYQEHLANLDRSERTIKDYIGILRRMDRELAYGLTGACTDELMAWIISPKRGPATRSLYTTIVLGFCNWATDPIDPRLDFNAAIGLPQVRKPKRKPKPIRTEQLADILARAAEPYRTWFTIAAYAGLRCCEIAGLDRAHITEQHIWVYQGKGRKERLVPAHPAVWRAVADLPPGPIALDHDGRTRLTAEKVSHRGNHQLRGPLGYPGVSMHRLRHWHGTFAYRSTKDLRAVQELLGHSSVATTQGYVEVAEEQKLAAVSGLPDVALVAV